VLVVQVTDGSGTPGFILLCGCPRSGTTLLSQHFGRALHVAMPIETHFIPHFQRYLWLWGDVTKPAKQKSLIDAMSAYTRIWIFRGIRAQNPDRHALISLLPILDRMQPVNGGFPSLLGSMYRQYAAGVSMTAYGDKSATFDPDRLELYDRSVSNLKVVHLIRDGRDVYRSWSSLWFGPRSTAEAAVVWREHVETRRLWGRQHPDRYTEVRYEDFVAEPTETLARIADFLQVAKPEIELTDDKFGDILRNEPTHTKLSEPVDAANTGGWRTALSLDDVALFEFIAGETLRSCGYEVVTCNPDPMTRAKLLAMYLVGYSRRFLGANYYMRRARAQMPFVFRLMQIFGISVRWFAESITGRRLRRGR
jgi:Sulfotransferase family